ncbi:hypothetical protein Dimus_005873 [Dionaea muscipula]
MAAEADPSSEQREPSPSPYISIDKGLKSLRETNPWVEYAVQQALLAQKSIQETADSAIAATRSRLSQIRLTSAAHSRQTIESVKELKAEFDAYEAQLFGKIKEGALVAASNPLASSAVAVGVGIFLLKGPRHFLYYKTLRLFVSPEASLSKADSEFKELRQTFERLKAESEKLEKRASVAEQEMKRGRTKLSQAGTLIHKVIRSADKIERRASGLKDALLELLISDSSRFRSQVSNLASEVKREKRSLAKVVTKITNYGISV